MNADVLVIFSPSNKPASEPVSIDSPAPNPNLNANMRTRFILTAVVCLCVFPAFSRAAEPDLKLWYAQPAEVWTEALPVGNGRLGAMVFGGTSQEHLQLNESTVWAGGPYDPNK